MILYAENNLKNRFYKYYKLEDDYLPLDFIKDVKSSEIIITDYNVTDESDFGIINSSGNYSYEQLVSMYDNIINNSQNLKELYITLFCKYQNRPLNIQIWPKNKEVNSISNTNEIDINTIVERNKGRRL